MLLACETVSTSMSLQEGDVNCGGCDRSALHVAHVSNMHHGCFSVRGPLQGSHPSDACTCGSKHISLMQMRAGTAMCTLHTLPQCNCKRLLSKSLVACSLSITLTKAMQKQQSCISPRKQGQGEQVTNTLILPHFEVNNLCSIRAQLKCPLLIHHSHLSNAFTSELQQPVEHEGRESSFTTFSVTPQHLGSRCFSTSALQHPDI